MNTLRRVLLLGASFLSLVPAVAMAQNFSIDASTGPDLGVDAPRAAGLGNTDIRITIARIIRVAMSLLGIISVVIVLFGGFIWMTAGGNDEKIGEAKKWIFGGVIGLAIILSAFAISSFVINSLVNATATGDAGPGFTSN